MAFDLRCRRLVAGCGRSSCSAVERLAASDPERVKRPSRGDPYQQSGCRHGAFPDAPAWCQADPRVRPARRGDRGRSGGGRRSVAASPVRRPATARRPGV